MKKHVWKKQVKSIASIEGLTLPDLPERGIPRCITKD